jgi:hypothetical protein
MAHTSGFARDTSPSTLASVFRYKDLVEAWSKSRHQYYKGGGYAKLHEEFWGKSMAIEEQEWRDSQEATDLAMDVTVADGDDSNPESEAGPGCYPLDFCIHKSLRTWIRKDFIRMYDFCDQWYERVTGSRANKQAPSVVIAGQSGVG